MDSDTLTVWLDTALLMLGGFVLMTVLMMTIINPPVAKEAADETAPGNVIVEIRWPDGMPTDVDLWVQAPGDVPVGYTNKGGDIFNLLRDDLGNTADITPLNYEISYSRGMPAGEYIVNVHSYRGQVWPVPVRVVVSTKPSPISSSTQVLTTMVELRKENEELTALRFRLDSDGRLMPGSVNSIYKPLRAAGSQ